VQIISSLYKANGEIDGKLLDGVFAFCLVDLEKRKVIIGRDRFGVRPLYKLSDGYGFLAISSEEQGLLPLLQEKPERKLEQFPAGRIEEYNICTNGLLDFAKSTSFRYEHGEYIFIFFVRGYSKIQFLTVKYFDGLLEKMKPLQKAVVKMVENLDHHKLGIIVTPEITAMVKIITFVALAKEKYKGESKIQVFFRIALTNANIY
jgi:hypothetical protein